MSMRPPPHTYLVAALLVTSGCLGLLGPADPPSDQRTLDALDRSRAAVSEITSYRTTLDRRLELTTDDERQIYHVSGIVVVNASTQRMNATARVRDEARTTYITGETAYSECSRLGWDRRNLTTPGSWLAYTPVGQQLAVLNHTNVYWRGTESIDGIETAVIVAYPTKQELLSGPDVADTRTAELAAANLKNATVTAWLNTETWRPLQVRREITLAQGDEIAQATVTFHFTGYDDPTTVTRPAFDEDSIWTLGCPGED